MIMKRLNPTTFTLLALLCSTAAVSAQDHDHDHGSDHPDLELEVEDGAIHIHPESASLFVSHEHYAFTAPTSAWRALFPGFEGEGLGASRTFDLISTSPLYVFDASAPDGAHFVAATAPFIRVINADVTEQIDITGSSSVQTLLAGIGTTDGDGDLHQHPTFQLRTIGSGAPADGVYLVGFQAASPGLATSDPFWLLFHKGVDDATYDTAIHEAQEQFDIQVVPEPASLAMLAATGLVMLRRRR